MFVPTCLPISVFLYFIDDVVVVAFVCFLLFCYLCCLILCLFACALYSCCVLFFCVYLFICLFIAFGKPAFSSTTCCASILV